MSANNKWITRFAAASAVTIATALPLQAQAAVGRTAGAASVSATGAGTYSIPLTLPPGTHGMTPSLSLNYNSGLGNGVVGVGWRIGGLSAITRCGRTWAQDTEARDIRLDYSDRFCLDGNKLRSTNGTTYGFSGATYETEIATFSVVTSFGTVGSGPTNFTVKSRDGLTYEYGNTSDSRIEVIGRSPDVRAWLLNKVTDTTGNSMTFTYNEDATNGSYQILTVQYTSNSVQGLAATYTVEFVYETKLSSEIDTRYVAGGVIKEIKRLDRVDVKYNTTVVHRYELTYEGTLSSTSKSRLASVQECAGSPLDCFPATTFSYQNGTTGIGSEVNTGLTITQPWAIDVNGDGRDDLVYATASTWMVALATTSGGYGSAINTGISSTTYLFADATPIDYNADGMEDILVPGPGGTWYVMLGSASGLATPSNTSAPVTTTGKGYNARAMDIDGDGLEDLVWADLVGFGNATQTDAIRYRLRVWGGAFGSAVNTLYQASSSDEAIGQGSQAIFEPKGQFGRRRQPDFNGDGRDDVILRDTFRIFNEGTGQYRYSKSYVAICPGNCAFSSSGATSTPSTSPSFEAPYFGDFNGDGKSDILYQQNASPFLLMVRLSKGNDFTAEISPGINLATYDNSRVITDWDGDGYDDILVRNITTGELDVYRSTGESFAAVIHTGIITSNFNRTISDINGDGLPDIGSTTAVSGGSWTYRLHPGSYPDLLQTATDGNGNTVTFNYAPLTSGNYTKYADATYPDQDYQGPMYVVNSYTGSDGIGGTFTNSLWYYGARINLQGRGYEGLYAKSTVDSRNQLHAYQYFRRDFPYTGAVYQGDVYQPDHSTLIADVQNSFVATTLDSTANNQRYFPHLSSSTTLNYEAGGTKNGQLISTAVTSYTFDTSGNATNVATTVTDNDVGSPYYTQQWSSTTAKTISPQAGCLGLPTQITVTNSAPGVPSITRTTGFTPNYTLCRMSQVVNEPASGTYKVTHDLGYDGFGNLNSETVTGIGMAARGTLLSWGSTGQFPVSVTNPLSQATSMGYDYSIGVQTSQTDPNGIAVTWGYDGFGRKTSELRADNTSTNWTYAACTAAGCFNSNNRMTVTQTDRNVDTSVLTDQFTYLDQLDRPLASKQRLLDGTYSQVETRYDALGRVGQQSAPCAATSCVSYWNTFAYDMINRVTQQQRPISATNSTLQSTSIAYLGRTTIVTDAQGKTSTKISTVAGTLGRSQDHNGYYQGFTYDAFGSLLSVIDNSSPANTLFSATYDYGVEAYQRTITDMDLGTRSSTFNALGEITNGSDGKGQSFSAAYDALSRPLTRTESEGVTTWAWDGTGIGYLIGRLSSVTSPGYAESNTYDTKGRLVTHRFSTDQIYDFDYSYNGNTGLLDTLTYPTSTASYRLKLQYLYANGILQQVKDYNASTVFWQANAMNPRGQVTQETLGNGVVTNRALDAVTGWISNLQSGVGGGAGRQNESYLFDLVGNLTQRQNGNLGLTENFYYDNLYRLDHSTLGAATNLSLTYDAMGNITSRSDIASGAAWTYDTVKKHAVRQAGSAAYTYTYDANGNAITRNGYNITWTSYNYPSVINGPNKSMTFSYGPARQRFKQVYNNGSTVETTQYVGGLLEKVTAGGTVDWRHYISAGGATVAIMSRQSTGTNTTRYLLDDHQGSIAQITDSSGAAFVGESFTAFGARRDATTWAGGCNCTDLGKMKSATRMGYTGQEAIGGQSMGLNHMNGRVQDAITGRFLSADPYVTEPGNTQGFNRYSYVMNNPLSFTDPTGFGRAGRSLTTPSHGGGSADSTAPTSEAGPENVLVEASRIHDNPLGMRPIDLLNMSPADLGLRGDSHGGGGDATPPAAEDGINSVLVTASRIKATSTSASTPPASSSKDSHRRTSACATMEAMMRPDAKMPSGGPNQWELADSQLTAIAGVMAYLANSKQGDALIRMTSDANERSALSSSRLLSNEEVFGPFLRGLGYASLGVNAAQVAIGYRDGGLGGAAYATTDATVTNTLARGGGWGVVAALVYNAIGGSKGIANTAVMNGDLEYMNALMYACGFESYTQD